jgi:nicotinic acid phosphoribosyltransferase
MKNKKTKQIKRYSFLETDFYQLAMAFVFVSEKLNKKVGFEGFVRNIKEDVNENKDFYIFDGNKEVNNYINKIREELKDENLVEVFIDIIKDKVTAPNKEILIEQFRKNWNEMDKSFDFSIVPNGTVVNPLFPVFQYYGNQAIGSIIETMVTNIYNGRTGLKTLEYLINKKEIMKDSKKYKDYLYLKKLMNNKNIKLYKYEKELEKKAKRIRKSTDKTLLEAAFRRCINHIYANIASKIALKNGFQGTSNTSLYFENKKYLKYIGGTMAHAFVMSFSSEREAFIVWNKYFPKTTFLIDTYDVFSAIKTIKDLLDQKLIEKPKDLRIDSDPLDIYAKKINDTFNGDIGVFLSGDLDEYIYKDFEEKNIEYSKSMIGTKYVHCNETKLINSGFVYKLVYVKEDGNEVFPQKKATNKSNFSGLKDLKYYDKINDILYVSINKSMDLNRKLDLSFAKCINEKTKIVFEF